MEAWAIGALAGFVDACFLPTLVPRAIPFGVTLYGVLGAALFLLIRSVLGVFLSGERSVRWALGLEAGFFALLFAGWRVTTLGAGPLATPAGQKLGLALAAVGAIVVVALVAAAWRPLKAPRTPGVLLGLALLVWPVSWGIESVRGAAAPSRGVLLISLDAARGDRISAWGYPRPTTPNIDRLVGGGLSYTNAIVQCPASGPSHATMLTGLPPLAHQVLRNADVLDDAVLTVAERLAAEGFATAGFADNFYIDARFGFDQGFQTWINEYRASRVATWQPQHLVKTTVLWHLWVRLSRAPGEKNLDTLHGAVQWLRHRPVGDWFLFVHFMDPHAPYDAPGPIRDRFYAPEGEPVRDTVALRRRLGEATEEEIAALRDLYDASIALADEKVGRLLDELVELGLLEETLVVVTADHGEVLDENGPVFDHGLPDQGNLHVPLVLGGGLAPGSPGQRIAAAVASTAWVPTAFELLDIGYEEQGTQPPLAPLPLSAREVRPVYGLTGVSELDESYAIDAGLKLRLGRGGHVGCYDLAADPFERHDLCADSAATREEFLALESGLLDWLEATAAAGIVSGRRSDENFDPATREQLEALGYID